MRNKLLALVALFLLGGVILVAASRDNINVLGSSQDAAGSRVGGGCIGTCEPRGYTDLSGQSDVVLENVHISNPNGRCLSIDNARNITVRNSVIGPCGTDKAVIDGYETGMITIRNSNNVRLEGNWIEDISNERFIENRNDAIWVTNSPNVTIVDNTIKDVHSDISQKNNNYGNRAVSVNGNSPGFKLMNNTFLNAGRNALQFQRNYNVSGVEITNNRIEGRGPFDSDYEDMINLYGSTGTTSSPILVEGNYFRNGGPSTTGTGLIVGDGNPSIGTNANVIIRNNVMVDPGHVGIGIAGGQNITVTGNMIYGANHPQMPRTSVGMYVNHFTSYGATCSNILVSNNQISFANPHVGGTNHLYNPNTCSGARLVNNTFGANLDASIWDIGEAQTLRTPELAPVAAPTTAAPTTAAPTTAAPTTAAPTTAAPTTAAPTTAAPTTAAPTTAAPTTAAPTTAAPTTAAPTTAAPTTAAPTTAAPTTAAPTTAAPTLLLAQQVPVIVGSTLFSAEAGRQADLESTSSTAERLAAPKTKTSTSTAEVRPEVATEAQAADSNPPSELVDTETPPSRKVSRSASPDIGSSPGEDAQTTAIDAESDELAFRSSGTSDRHQRPLLPLVLLGTGSIVLLTTAKIRQPKLS